LYILKYNLFLWW